MRHIEEESGRDRSLQAQQLLDNYEPKDKTTQVLKRMQRKIFVKNHASKV